jgi:hypothetical protein
VTPKIGYHLGRTLLVSIPALFADGVCRPFTLRGADLHGLWLQSDELTRRLLPKDQQDLATIPAAVFVPFAQIAGVLVAAAPSPGPAQEDAAPSAGAVRGRTRARSTPKDGAAKET